MRTQNQISITPSHFQRRLLPYHHLQINNFDVYPDREEVEFNLNLVEEPPLICSVCEAPAAGVHRLLTRKVRDLNVNGNKVFLKRPYRRINCDECGKSRSQKIYITRRNKQLTNRLARYVNQLSERLDLDLIASAQGLAWETVKSIADESIPEPGPGQGPVIYGLDVIRRNQDLREVVILDYLSGGTIRQEICPNREKMIEWLENWSEDKSDILAANDLLLLSEQPLMKQILIDQVGENHVLRSFQ